MNIYKISISVALVSLTLTLFSLQTMANESLSFEVETNNTQQKESAEQLRLEQELWQLVLGDESDSKILQNLLFKPPMQSAAEPICRPYNDPRCGVQI